MLSQTAHDWVSNPFVLGPHPALNWLKNEQLIDLSKTSFLKERFEKTPMAKFWAEMFDAFPLLSRIALQVAVLFVTTYLCE